MTLTTPAESPVRDNLTETNERRAAQRTDPSASRSQTKRHSEALVGKEGGEAPRAGGSGGRLEPSNRASDGAVMERRFAAEADAADLEAAAQPPQNVVRRPALELAARVQGGGGAGRKPKKSSKKSPKDKKSPSRKGSSRSRRDYDELKEGGGGKKPRKSKNKKKSNSTGIVVVVCVAVAGWYFLGGSSGSTSQATKRCARDVECVVGGEVCDSVTHTCRLEGPAPPPPPSCASCDRGYYCDEADSRHCLTCPVGRYDHDGESTSACRDCGAGTYAAEGSYNVDECTEEDMQDVSTDCTFVGQRVSGCSLCSPGMFDHDQSSSTPCIQCPVGKRSAHGATACITCTLTAELNHESDCTACPAGKELEIIRWEIHSQYSGMANGVDNGEEASRIECVDCPAGKADVDHNATSRCGVCRPGTYAGTGQTECAPCAPSMYDHDSDPASPCRRCPQVCRDDSTGQAREGVNKVTCESLVDEAGEPTHEWVDYYSGSGDTVCIPPAVCAPGMFKLGKVCHQCPAGQFDRDGDPATPCELCNPGMQSSDDRLRCDFCPAGRADTDSNPATNCTGCAAGKHSFMGGTQCTACARGQADIDGSAATPCEPCVAGQHSEEGSVTCRNCTAGTVDEDLDPSTLCQPCLTGRYAPEGTAQCVLCRPGWADSDSNPGTPCRFCPGGTTTCDAEGLECSGKTSCTQCPSGKHTEPGDPGTPCVKCPPGRTVNSALDIHEQGCTDCTPGQYDHDQDSQTLCVPCEAGTFSNYSAFACDLCEPGYSDEDMDPSTPCEYCGAGTYTGIGPQAVAEPAPETPNRVAWGAKGGCCSHALYLSDHRHDETVPDTAAEWALLDSHDCSSQHCCPPGKVDNDTDPSTPCTDCEPGGYTMRCSTSCGVCHEGTADLDHDPSTPCDLCLAGMYSIDRGHCVLCEAGRTDHDSDSATPCVDCAPGSFSDRGEFTCHECVPGQYDHDAYDPDVRLSASTPCESCEVGQYSGRSEKACYDCQAGKADHDRSPSTP